MIARLLDNAIGVFSPAWAVQRMHARKVQRSYQGAEANRLTNHKKPRNQAADQELLGPFGADALRAWARALVRDNAYAWNVVDTIVSNVIGTGISAQSVYETPDGDDIEDANDLRDALWSEWCEVCDINGELSFHEIQSLAMREMVEAGEVLVRFIRTPGKEYRGIRRPVPLALELIEADRLSLDRDTYTSRVSRENGNRIIRGVEVDQSGKPIAYWIYPEHPNSPYSVKNQTPERVPANEIRHLYRKDRVGQTRGVSWFAPIMSWMRDLGVYVDNEIQASAVASCFGVAIKTEGPAGSLAAPSGEGTVDDQGNSLEYLEPAMVVRLRPGESVESINPGRPNSASEPWINLMLRGIAAGTGCNYEAVSKDFSKTSYSSSRTSKLEDKPRYERWQMLVRNDLCQPTWDEFCNAAALVNADGFPDSSELLEARRTVAPVEWLTPESPWVDPASEESAAVSGINNFTTTYQAVIGSKGGNVRATFYQRAKENRLRAKLGLLTSEERTQQMMAAQTAANAPAGDSVESTNVAAAALNGAQVTSLVDVITQVGTGAMPNETAKAILAAAFPDFAPELINQIIDPIEPGSIAADGVPSAAVTPLETPMTEQPSGVYMGLSTQQWNRNRKAIQKTLDELAAGTMSEATARVFLASVGMQQSDIDILIADAADGSLDTSLPAEEVPADVQP